MNSLPIWRAGISVTPIATSASSTVVSLKRITSAITGR